jgi:O-antigen ligase
MSQVAGADVAVALPSASHLAGRIVEGLALTLTVLIFVAPFTQPLHRLPQAVFDSEWTAAVLLAGAAVALGLLRSREIAINLPLPLWLAALALVVAIQHALGRLNYPSQLALACVYAFAIAGAYLVGRAWRSSGLSERLTTGIAMGLLVGAVVSVAIQWLQLQDVRDLPTWLYFDVADPSYGTRQFGNLGQPNQLATYLVWAIFAALYLHGRSLRFPLTVICAFVLATGLALTRSRMGLVFGIALLAACWVPSALRPPSARDRAAISLALALGYVAGSFALLLLVVFQGGAVDTAFGRFNQSGGFSIRLAMWVEALRVAATAPWLGTGFDQFAFSQYWLEPPGQNRISTQNVHNLLLQTAAELGWPMAVALGLLAIWWVCAEFQRRVHVRETAFAWALLAVVGCHALLEWPLQSLHFAIPVALLFALGEPTAIAKFATSRVATRTLLAIGAAGLVLAATMKLEFDEISDVFYRTQAERKSPTGVDEETLRKLVSLANASLLRIYPELLLVSLRQPDRVDPTDDEIKLHERVMIRSADPRVIARLVLLNAHAGRIDESIRHAQRLAAFSGDQYAALSRMILEGVASLGPAADPLRRQLEAAAGDGKAAPR